MHIVSEHPYYWGKVHGSTEENFFLKCLTFLSHGHEFLRHYCGKDIHAMLIQVMQLMSVQACLSNKPGVFESNSELVQYMHI
jgi:hypothetical protein